MASNTKKTATVKDIGAMLRLRSRTDTSDHHHEIWMLAKVISGVADEETTQQVEQHLTECEACRNTLLNLQLADDTPTAEASPHEEASVSVPKARNRRLPIYAVAAVFIASFAAILFLSLKEDSNEEGQILTKGAKDALQVAIHREDRFFRAAYLQRLRNGDRLGLFYTAEEAGYLAVLNRDGQGKISVLYPTKGIVSGVAEKGEQISIPDGAVVEDGTGCEWIIGVFSDTPLFLDTISKKIETGTVRRRCGLELKIEEARSISILPFRR